MSEDEFRLDGEQLATVAVTNAADTDELQTLITLLENRFTVDVRMQDGEMRVLRDSRDSSDAESEDEISAPDKHRDIDELLEGMVEAVRDMKEGRTTSDIDELRRQIRELREAGDMEVRVSEEYDGLNGREVIEKVRQSNQDIAEGRTSALDEVRKDLDESETAEQTAEDESDEAESDEPMCQYCGDTFHPNGVGPHERHCSENPDSGDDWPECQYCGDEFHPKGVTPHERHCPENPANQQDETDEDDSDESNEYPAASVAVDGYRCLGCGESFGTERGARVHQGRSRDCTGAEIEPVEQTDTSSESAGSAADPTGDTETPDDTDETEADDDPALDPAVGAVPIDPDTVDEAVVDDDAAPNEPENTEQDEKQRVRREPSTVREVLDAAVPGTYLCMDCGFLLGAGEDATAVRHHDFRRHERYTDENGDAYRQLADVPDDALAERWLLTYKNVGSNWTHPKVHEARKNGIVAVLEEAEYFLDVSELRERLNELLQVSGSGQHGRRLSREQLTSELGYLDELVEEGRIERDGKTYGVDAKRAAEIVEATA